MFVFHIQIQTGDVSCGVSCAGYVILEDNNPLSEALEDKRLPESLFKTVQADNHGTEDQHVYIVLHFIICTIAALVKSRFELLVLSSYRSAPKTSSASGL